VASEKQAFTGCLYPVDKLWDIAGRALKYELKNKVFFSFRVSSMFIGFNSL
jgi:hypothetical protein